MVSAITKLWAKKLEDGTKAWDEVPESRREDVKTALEEDVAAGKITAREYEGITGGVYDG